MYMWDTIKGAVCSLYPVVSVSTWTHRPAWELHSHISLIMWAELASQTRSYGSFLLFRLLFKTLWLVSGAKSLHRGALWLVSLCASGRVPVWQLCRELETSAAAGRAAHTHLMCDVTCLRTTLRLSVLTSSVSVSVVVYVAWSVYMCTSTISTIKSESFWYLMCVSIRRIHEIE